LDFVPLTEFLVKSVVKEPDMVRVKAFEDDEDKVVIEVLVSNEDMGRVIGRKGVIANAIRTIVQASSYIHENRLVTINIDSF